MQVRRRVKLPSSSLILYWKFCKVIAEAIGPRYKNLEGIDCVAGKIYPTGVSAPIPGQAGPYDLVEDDFQPLAKALADLPRLRYPMSEKETASFMVDYGNLPNRPTWVPSLVTNEMIPMLKREQDNVMSKHINAVRKERKAGRLVAVDTTNVPVEYMQFGAHLTRKDAIEYLERHGLAYEGEETAIGPKQDTLSSEAAHQSHNAGQVTLTGKPKRGVIRFSAATKAKAVKRCKELRAAGEDKFAKITAKEFKTSERSIYTWVQEAEKAEPSNHFWRKTNN